MLAIVLICLALLALALLAFLASKLVWGLLHYIISLLAVVMLVVGIWLGIMDVQDILAARNSEKPLTTGQSVATETPVQTEDSATKAPATKVPSTQTPGNVPNDRHIGGWGTGIGKTASHDWDVPTDHVLIVWGVKVDGTDYMAKAYDTDPGLIEVKDGYGFVVHEDFANAAFCDSIAGAGQIDSVDPLPGWDACS